MTVTQSTASTITTGGTSQRVFEHNKQRKYLLVQNTSDEDLWVNYGKAASAASPSILLEPGDAIHFAAGFAPDASIHIFGASSTKTFTAHQG